MSYPKKAVPVWFGKGRQMDVQVLNDWRQAPLTYSPEQETDHQWNADHYEVILGKDNTGDLFQRAAQLTLHNQFYPAEVMSCVSDYDLEGRSVKAGDRVLQRIHVFQYNTLPILEILTMNEITAVIDEPRRAGFTYTTTAAHSEVGEWSPVVEWRENGEVVLVISVLSRVRPGASRLARSFARHMQLRAHRMSIDYFLSRLTGKQSAMEYLPWGHTAPALLLLMAGALLLITWLGFGRRSKS